jgi:energy-converting hydrogenase Eha subunit F
LLNRYHIDEPLAQGTLCAVYRGRDTVLHRSVVVKVIPPELVGVYREALHLTAAFTHPVVVATYDAVEERDALYLVQEHVQARPLAAYARDGIPSERAVDLAAQIARALAYAHAHDIVHGDLTPAAILIDRQATVRINNFGLPPDTLYFAKQTQSVRDAYVAADTEIIDLDAPARPAIRTSAPHTMPRASDDVCAVGLLLWQVLTEQTRVSDAAGQGPGRQFRRDVPPVLRDLVWRCALEDHPEAVVDADALVAELDTAASFLVQGRAPAPALTPPALRVAREAVAREAAWSVEETLGSVRRWPAELGRDSGSPSAPTVADPVPGRRGGWSPSQPTAKMGPSRLNLPSHPLDARSRISAGAGQPRSPAWERAQPSSFTRRWPWLESALGSVSLGRLLVYGLLLFLLFFLIGYFGPNILGSP